MLNFIKDNWVSITKGPAQLLLNRIIRDGETNICIYGAGVIGQNLVALLKQKKNINIELIVDRKAESIPVQLEGFQVGPPNQLNDADCKCVVIASEKFVEDIANNIRNIDTKSRFKIISV